MMDNMMEKKKGIMKGASKKSNGMHYEMHEDEGEEMNEGKPKKGLGKFSKKFKKLKGK